MKEKKDKKSRLRGRDASREERNEPEGEGR
jgi:hypothetical protein